MGEKNPKTPNQNRVLKDYWITKKVVAYAVRIPEGEEREKDFIRQRKIEGICCH